MGDERTAGARRRIRCHIGRPPSGGYARLLAPQGRRSRTDASHMGGAIARSLDRARSRPRASDGTRRAAPPSPSPRRRRDDTWLERWMATVADLARLKASHPMLDAVIDEQDRALDPHRRPVAGRLRVLQLPRVRSGRGDHRDRSRSTSRRGARIRAGRACSGARALRARSRRQMTELLGCEDALLLPTITHIHMSVIPVLVGSGVDLPGRPGPQDDLRRLLHRREATGPRSNGSATTTRPPRASSSRDRPGPRRG